MQWNDSRIGIETAVFADFTAIPNGGGTMRYAGPFTNTTLGLSGSVYLDIQVEPTTVSGYINFTDGPDVSGVLCGANSFSGTRSGNTFQFSFVSDDPEPGCSITDGLTFNVSGTISGNEIINGSFSVPSLGQSGTFSAKQTLRRNGRFVNDTLTADGDVYVDLAFGTVVSLGISTLQETLVMELYAELTLLLVAAMAVPSLLLFVLVIPIQGTRLWMICGLILPVLYQTIISSTAHTMFQM